MNASPSRKTAVILAVLILLVGVLLLMVPQPDAPAPSALEAPVLQPSALRPDTLPPQAPNSPTPGASTAPTNLHGAPTAQHLHPPEPSAPASNYTAMLLQMILSVALVCLLAWAILRWGLGRLVSTRSDTENLRILSRLAIGPRRSILVVQAGEKCLLLGSTETEISLLCEFSENNFQAFTKSQVVESKG